MQQEVFTTDHVIGKKGHILVVQMLTGKIYMGMLISHYISMSANVRLSCSYHCNRKNFPMQKKAFTTDNLTGKKKPHFVGNEHSDKCVCINWE